MDRAEEIIVRSVLQSLPVGLAIIDPQGEIVEANQALCTILGYPREKLTSTGWGLLFFHVDKNVEFNQVLIDVIHEEKMHLVRSVDYERDDGVILRLSITSSFLRDGDAVAGIVILMQDVTENHTMHLREKRVLEERSRIQRERGEGLRKLALSVAHQIRNPVMGIGGLAGLANRKAGQVSSIAKYLEGIREECKKLEMIVAAVADFANIPHPNPHRMSVAGIVDEARNFLEKLSARLGIAYELEQDVTICHVFADDHLLSSALNELLSNALEAGKENGDRKGRKVVVSLHVTDDPDGWVVFSVRDNGRGIAEENIPYLFDPFYTSKAVGVGMGLAVVKRIATELGGSVSVQSMLGQGATFTLTLPANDPELHACPFTPNVQ